MPRREPPRRCRRRTMARKRKRIGVPGRLTLRERMAKWSPEAKGAGLLLVAAALTGIAAHRASGFVHADPGLAFSAGQVDVQGLPAWLDPESTAALRTASAGLGRIHVLDRACLLYTSPSPRDRTRSRMPSSA